MLASLPDARVAPLHILHTVGGWTGGVCVCAYVCKKKREEAVQRQRQVKKEFVVKERKEETMRKRMRGNNQAGGKNEGGETAY